MHCRFIQTFLSRSTLLPIRSTLLPIRSTLLPVCTGLKKSATSVHTTWLTRIYSVYVVQLHWNDYIVKEYFDAACGLQVNDDGLISFGSAIHRQYVPRSLPISSPSTPFIAPFWADVDTTRNNGRIYYRSVTSGICLHDIADVAPLVLFLVCVSLTIIGQPRNSFFIRRV